MAAVPTIFNQPGVSFIFLKDGIKYPPYEKEWQKKGHTFQEATAHKGNVGILAGNGHIGLDLDVPEAFQGIEFPESTAWETQPGRLGMRFICRDRTPELLASYGKKADLSQFKLFKNGLPVGEVKLERSYQVIPPSWKIPEKGPNAGRRVDYKLLKDIPPAEISLKWLLSELQRIGITFEEKRNTRLEQNVAKLESINKEAKRKNAEPDDQKARRYAEAALESEIKILANTSDGARNDQLNKSAFSLGQFVGSGILSESEVVRELSNAASFTGLSIDEIARTIESGLLAGYKHPREIPSPWVKIEEKCKENPASIKIPENIAVIAEMRASDPVEYDLFLDEMKKSRSGIKGTTINKLVDKYLLENPPELREDKEIEEIPEDIQKIAMRIAEHGKPLKFMLNTFNKTHKGDKFHAESQFIGFGLQSAYNTKGVFGTWDGPSGKGKSDGARACIRQLPSEYTIISSVTAKSLYHRAKNGGILPGSVLFLDDKNIESGSDLEETLKRIQTFFQEGAEHETIDSKKGYIRTRLPPRLFVVRTYVDSIDSNEQLNNRTVIHGVDSSKEIDKEVCDLVLKLGEEGQTTDIVTKQTLICRAIWRDIKSHAYRVITPASSQIVEFTDVSNRRNPSLFLDMVIGLACIHHRQRLTEDGPNGERFLYASYEDYLEATKLFNSQGDYLGTRLDKAEYEAVKYIKDIGEATVPGIFSHLSSKFPNDGWNMQKVRRLIEGRTDRPDSDVKGLVGKVPGLSSKFKSDDKSSPRYKVYSIPGDLALGIHVRVHDPRTKDISDEQLSQLSHRCPILGK